MPLVSQNELGGLTEKAWRGLSVDCPVPWGLAKDSNIMVQWLASRGLGFADSLIECLAMVKENPMLAHKNPLDSGVMIAPLHGMVMLDSILAEGMVWNGQIYGAHFIMAGMGLLLDDDLAKSRDHAARLTLSDDDGIAAEWGDQMIRMRASMLSNGQYELRGGDHADRQANISLTTPNSPSHNSTHAIDVNDAVWQQMLEHAQNSYVPENELSRSRGAGAGNIDND
jgi:hypothetical protein